MEMGVAERRRSDSGNSIQATLRKSGNPKPNAKSRVWLNFFIRKSRLFFGLNSVVQRRRNIETLASIPKWGEVETISLAAFRMRD